MMPCVIKSTCVFKRKKNILRGSTILKSMTAIEYLLITSGLQVGFD